MGGFKLSVENKNVEVIIIMYDLKCLIEEPLTSNLPTQTALT